MLIFAAFMLGTTVGTPFIVEYEYAFLLLNLHKWSAQFIGYGRFSVRRALQGHQMEESLDLTILCLVKVVPEITGLRDITLKMLNLLTQFLMLSG